MNVIKAFLFHYNSDREPSRSKSTQQAAAVLLIKMEEGLMMCYCPAKCAGGLNEFHPNFLGAMYFFDD